MRHVGHLPRIISNGISWPAETISFSLTTLVPEAGQSSTWLRTQYPLNARQTPHNLTAMVGVCNARMTGICGTLPVLCQHAAMR